MSLCRYPRTLDISVRVNKHTDESQRTIKNEISNLETRLTEKIENQKDGNSGLQDNIKTELLGMLKSEMNELEKRIMSRMDAQIVGT